MLGLKWKMLKNTENKLNYVKIKEFMAQEA